MLTFASRTDPVVKSRARSASVPITFLSAPLISLAALIVAFGAPTAPATAGGGGGDATIIFVDAALTTGGNDGSSWADAFQGQLGLQAALGSIPPGGAAQIWVADGQYAPAPTGFVLGSGVAVLGGFAGGETSIDQRDPARNVAVLTGNLSIPHVVRMINADATCLLDGVTVCCGKASFAQGPGGNILVQGGAPVIRQCIVDRGQAFYGGGLACLASQPKVHDCLFTDNHASAGGGGVFHSQGSAGIFTKCIFQGNDSPFGGGFYSGEGDPLNKPLLQDCLFFSNGGGLSGGSGLGFVDGGGQPILERCRFINNITVAGGGGVFLWSSSATFRECDFVGNAGQFDGGGAVHISAFSPSSPSPPQFISCRFVGNVGAIYGGPADLTNCTVANNDGFITPFVFWATFTSGSLHLRNCIVWGNHATAPGPAGIFENGGYIVDDSLVQGWDGSLPGTGTVALDPRFVDSAGTDDIPGTEDDDLHVLPGSPAIDAGNDASVPRGIDVDFDGNPRFVDGDGDRVVQVDIGAYEHPAAAVPEDLNGDGHVTGLDLAMLLGQWGRCQDRRKCPADLDHSGVVNGFDLAMLLGAWG